MKPCIRRLKYTSLFKFVSNNAFIYVFLIVLFLITIHQKSIITGIIIILYLLYLLKKSPKCVLYAVLILLIVLVNYSCRSIYFRNLYQENYQGYAKIEQIKKTSKKYQIRFKLKKGYVLYYSEESLSIGSVYYIEGNVQKFYQSHYPGGFNYYQYASFQNLYGTINVEKMIYQKQSFSIYYFNDCFNRYYDTHYKTESVGMIKALTIGSKDSFDKTLNDSISQIGISHLFVISGLHVSLISLAVSKILSLFKKWISSYHQEIITMSILFFYFVITGFLISVFRVVFGAFLKYLNKKMKLEISPVNLLLIQIILLLLYNPFYLFQYSFILSYCIVLSILMVSGFLGKSQKIKTKIFNQLSISLLSILVTLPMVVNINPDINFLAMLYNLFYIPVVSYIMLPLAFLVSFIYPLEPVFNFIYELFKRVTLTLSKVRFFTITYPMVPIEVMILYYGCIYLFFLRKEARKKTIHLVCLFFVINLVWINISFFHSNQEVFFLDLPKGEAVFIKDAWNQKNILIDTGEAGYNDILLFLKKQGVKRLDSIIISHGDSDHVGMLEELILNFKVKEVIFSGYDSKTYHLTKQIKQKVIKSNQTITFNKNIQMSFLPPTKDYGSTNNNSLVIVATIFQKKYLFTGDIEKEREMDLPTIGAIDYLKVPHHGSNTSSSSALFRKVKFKYAICMNGYQNSYAFPTSVTIKKYQEQLYVTSKEGTIIIKNK